jgi:hypothetical protein
MTDLGRWMARRYRNCQARRLESESVLGEMHELSIDNLRYQWNDQVVTQTQPLPRKRFCFQLSSSANNNYLKYRPEQTCREEGG